MGHNQTDLVVDGDTTIAVVYRLIDSDGRIWRSSPYILPNSLDWQGTATGLEASDFRVRLPTLRHLMAGTVAEIELYIGQVDLQLVRVVSNDPTVNYIDVFPCEWSPPAGLSFSTIAEAVAAAGPGEDLYTTGGALEAMAPPIARCAFTWRNRVFLASETDIYPSQEFAPGLGVRWNEVLRMSWTDGTGDILAICNIDWNYLAFFKRDAIAIVSGPGPDGMGNGNYIVQTLSTKAGCTNVKSIVNGADGLYFQDSQTGRIMLLNSSLQIQEAAPGAFDASAAPITCALHVEAQRQVWFFAAGSVNRLIVLDYKHRTQTAPCGSVYTWALFGGWAVYGMTIVQGAPVLILANGNTITQTTSAAPWWADVSAAGATVPIATLFKTGDMSPLGPQRQFNLCRVQLLGEYLDQHGLTITVTPDFGATSVSGTKTFTAAPEQLQYKPPSCTRIEAVQLQIAENILSAGTPPAPVIGAALKFVGFALVVQDYGKIAELSTGRMM
jgi:hypothetical protein